MLFALKNLRASRVNLLMNDFAAGLPSPLSFLGFGDTIVRRLGLTPWSARTLPILHRVDATDGRTKPEMENKTNIFSPIETMEDLTGTVDVSLLLEIPYLDSEAALREVVPQLRIAGGIIQNDDYTVERVTPDGSAFSNMRRGYAMIRPEQDDRRLICSGDKDGLTSIAATLFPTVRAPGSGWIVPVSVGYHLIEDPKTAPKRIRTRSRDVPHVFAEPVLGIAEMVSVRNQRLTNLTEEEFSALLWSWEARGKHVLGHPDYHAKNSENRNIEKVENHG
uniref:type I-F CRISPR-associated protein Csy2 n=1 Tax=Pararhizobium sp. IMCC3301 TaxID=3067904 RepID=UPI00274224C5|nr:type I-F CRISPR-associated protein Csy2 [Pararhizobium sp. IMCC3301]